MEYNNKSVPSLYEWAAGMTAYETLFQQFYDKVLDDDLLFPVFKHSAFEHHLHAAHFGTLSGSIFWRLYLVSNLQSLITLY